VVHDSLNLYNRQTVLDKQKCQAALGTSWHHAEQDENLY